MREKVVILRDDTIDLLEEAKAQVLRNNGNTTTYDKVIKKALQGFLE